MVTVYSHGLPREVSAYSLQEVAILEGQSVEVLLETLSLSHRFFFSQLGATRSDTLWNGISSEPGGCGGKL